MNEAIRAAGHLFVISAPSGAGKTSLVRALVARTANLSVSVSHTTRARRDGETDGADYHFVDAAAFGRMAANGEFLEHATVFDHAYGTSRAAVAACLEQGIDVLDVGCGRGRAMIQLAARFPNSTFHGYDISKEAVDHGNGEARDKGLDNVRLSVQDVAAMPDRQFGLITAFDAIHDQAAPATVLANVAKSLKRGGVFLMQDIHASSHVEKNLENPLAPFFYTISTMHCMTVSLAQDGAGLGTMWGEELAETMLEDAGFTGIRKHKLDHDFINVYFVMRKS